MGEGRGARHATPRRGTAPPGKEGAPRAPDLLGRGEARRGIEMSLIVELECYVVFFRRGLGYPASKSMAL